MSESNMVTELKIVNKTVNNKPLKEELCLVLEKQA